MKYTLFVALWCLTFAHVAQAQPKTQQNSLWAPAGIKIDGKTDEWKDQFQAYNKSTELYYTIANNDDNLYLLIKAAKSDIITKMVHSGITLAINTKEKKDNGSFSITYPTYQKKEIPLYLILSNLPERPKDPIKAQLQLDSFVNEKNTQLLTHLKYIGLKSITQVTDSITPVKNDEHILSAANLDKKLACIYELSIPLKLLGLMPETENRFYYHITLNGIAGKSGHVNIIETSRGEQITFTGADGVNYVLPSAGTQGMSLAFSTDFWGEYTLAKK